MSGTLLLSGGHEHMLPSHTIDRALLATLGTRSPRIAVVPATSSARKRPAERMGAVRHWSQLGATVDAADVAADPDDGRMPALLRDADVIVLTGGHPTRLATATATAWWPHVVTRWHQGAALSGSSAGAMVLCEWRQQLASPHPLRLVRGFGLLPACAAAPHFNRAVVRRWTMAASRTRPDVTILGLDERTAIIGGDGDYRVHGAGAATIIRAGVAQRYGAGRRLPPGLGVPLHTPGHGVGRRLMGPGSTERLGEPGATKFPRMWAPVEGARPNGRVSAG